MIASECVLIIVWKGARWVVSRDLYISEKLGGHLTSPSQKGQQKIASFGHFAVSLSPSFAVSKLTVFLLRPCPCCKRCREDMQLLEDTCERERIQRNELNRHLSISLIVIFYTILSKQILGFESLSTFFSVFSHTLKGVSKSWPLNHRAISIKSFNCWIGTGSPPKNQRPSCGKMLTNIPEITDLFLMGSSGVITKPIYPLKISPKNGGNLNRNPPFPKIYFSGANCSFQGVSSWQLTYSGFPKVEYS